MTGQRPVSLSLEELVALAELQDVIFYEISGKRTDEEPQDPQALRIEAMWRHGDQKLGIRFRASVSGEGGEFLADAEALFNLTEERDLDEGVIGEFVERVGIMVVYPFLRSAVAEMATKLSLPRPVLNLIRASEVQFSK